MKKILYVLILLIFPLAVYADSITINCPSEVAINSEFNCEITGTTSTKVSSVSADVSPSANLSYLSFIANSIWIGDGSNGKIDLYESDDKTGTFKIGTIKLKGTAAGNNTLTIENIIFYDDAKEIVVANASKTIKITDGSSSVNKDTNTNNNNNNSTTTNNNDDDSQESDEPIPEVISSTNLIDIVIDNYNLEFDKETLSYDLKIADENDLIIEPIVEDNSATVQVLGNHDLKNGSIITVTVTNGEASKTYTINIQKETQTKKNYSLVFIAIIGILVIVNIIRMIMGAKKKGSGVN